MTGLRILVTGSREWTDVRAIQEAMATYIRRQPTVERIVLVHGGARGADSIADNVWRIWMLNTALATPEIHRADWDRYGKSAGHRRNAEMIAAGADVVLAFPLGASPGTRGCIALAEKAGVPVVVYEGATA